MLVEIELGGVAAPVELGPLRLLLLFDLLLVLAQHLVVVVVQLFPLAVSIVLDLLRVVVALDVNLLQLLLFLQLRLLVFGSVQLELALSLLRLLDVALTLIGLHVVEAINLFCEQLSQLHLVTLLFERGLLHLQSMYLLIVQRDLVPVVVLARLDELEVAGRRTITSIDLVLRRVLAVHHGLTKCVLPLVPVARGHGREAEFGKLVFIKRGRGTGDAAVFLVDDYIDHIN